jgi:5-(carboxyamino)imidazole ribonucleotide mutase
MVQDLKPQVAVIMGSLSDEGVMSQTYEILKDFGVSFESKIVSAHRTPEQMVEYAKTARQRGIKVIIAAAGGAAHLPGMVASLTTLPVIGVPIKSQHSLGGLDSLYSIVQMPAGVPVATMAVDGAVNGGLMAVQILSLEDSRLSDELDKYKLKLMKKVDAMNSSKS